MAILVDTGGKFKFIGLLQRLAVFACESNVIILLNI